jgi:NodT family efflux transporter outer membrane factor (OMF) lipoprotein
MRPRNLLVALAVFSTACTVGPNYKQPTVPVPASFRAPEPLPPNEASSFADLKWFEVFKDDKLQDLMRIALKQNYDLRDAYTRVEEARASLGATRSNQFPNFGAGGAVNINRLSRDGETPIPPQLLPSQNRDFGTAVLQLLSFEIDIWGKLRRATEAARANLLSAEETRKAVVVTLVSDVATAYFTMRELDYTLQISRDTLKTREESLVLTRSRLTGGVGTRLDLRQAEQLVDTAAETIPSIQNQIEVTENQISLLLGQNPGDVLRGKSLVQQDLPPEVPPGLPSALLERRPDIRAAEQALIAANAEIGVARAAYFPTLSLSGALGGASTQLSSLFSGPNSTWNLAPQVTQPIFTAGRIRAGVKYAEAEHEHALIQYQKTIQTAFTEVANALSTHQRIHESREKQDQLVEALGDRLRLAYLRYRGGVDTQLNALDADRDLFQAQLDLAQLELNEVLSVVQLYKALGGGWQ